MRFKPMLLGGQLYTHFSQYVDSYVRIISYQIRFYRRNTLDVKVLILIGHLLVMEVKGFSLFLNLLLSLLTDICIHTHRYTHFKKQDLTSYRKLKFLAPHIPNIIKK